MSFSPSDEKHHNYEKDCRIFISEFFSTQKMSLALWSLRTRVYVSGIEFKGHALKVLPQDYKQAKSSSSGSKSAFNGC